MRHRIAALLGVMVCLALTVTVPAMADTSGSAVTVTKKITDGKGVTHTVSVTVSQTQNLLARQNVLVSWSGAAPTHNYSVTADPTLTNPDEYPMVLMECWGLDKPSNPSDPMSAGAMDPTHCATSMGLNAFTPAVVKDTNGIPNQPDNNSHVYNLGLLAHQLQFQAVDGTWYNMYYGASASQIDSIPPELRSGGSLALTARGEWSDAGGSRSGVPFEMRSSGEYPFLGCSDTQACSLVAVPIMDPQCNATAAAACSAGAKTPVGVGGQPVASVSPYLRANAWWLTTNWRNRISVGLTFAPQHPCDVVDQRKPVTISGSEPAGYALNYYWAPHFCLDPKSFRMTYVVQPEPLARTALTTSGPAGYGANAILTTLPATGSPRPVVHAPVLDAGFAVTFLIDDVNGGQITQLKLTPLMLAKLITQSYEAGSGEAALKGNPYSLFRDPEFLAVNPGFTLSKGAPPIDYNMIMPQPTQTDVIWALTSYINADPEARAWLDGAPDRYSGMVVNPVFRGYQLPQLFAELRDGTPDPAVRTATPQSGDYACVHTLNALPPYFNLVKQSVGTLQDSINALLARQSPAPRTCDSDPSSATANTFVKQAPQIVGTRNLIAITSVAQADTYVMPTAQLQVHQVSDTSRLFAGPSSDSMAAALGYTVQDKDTGVLSLDFPHLSPNSYPGTMPIYAAIPTAGLDKATAQAYASFLTFAATDGQTPGTNVGNLPPGYAPLPDVLRQYTLAAAAAVAAQNGQVPTPPSNIADQIRNQNGQSATVGNGVGDTPNSVPAGGSTPSTSAAPGAGDTPKNTPTTLATTRGVDSWLAAWGLPILLGIGLLAGVAVPLVRLAAQPGHPIRVAIAGVFSKVLSRRSS